VGGQGGKDRLGRFDMYLSLVAHHSRVVIVQWERARRMKCGEEWGVCVREGGREKEQSRVRKKEPGRRSLLYNGLLCGWISKNRPRFELFGLICWEQRMKDFERGGKK